jgi:hypothetical protein
MDMVGSMMAYSDLPLSFWGEALHTVVYLLNHSPSNAVTVTLYELWTRRKPSLRHLAVWGCNAQIRVPNQHRTKLHPKSTPGIFIGYSTESKGYRFYDPENNKLVESRDAIFLDHQTPRHTKRARVELLATLDEPHFDTSRINSLGEENITPEGNTNQTPNTSRLRRSGRNTGVIISI